MVSQSVPYHFQQRPMTLCNVNPWQSLDGLHILLFLEPANLANRTAHTVDLTWQKMWYGNKGFCGKVHGKMMTLFLHDPWRRWSKSFLIFRCVAAPQRPCVKEPHRVCSGRKSGGLTCLKAHPKNDPKMFCLFSLTPVLHVKIYFRNPCVLRQERAFQVPVKLAKE